MKVDLGIWDRLARMIIFLLVVAGLVVVAHSYVPQIRKNEIWRRKIHAIQSEIEAEIQRSNDLRAAIEAFYDPRVLEQRARVVLNYTRSNEVIFNFREATTPASPSR